MKTKQLFLIVVALFTLSIASACGVGRTLRGSGDIITENREVSGFDRVSLSGFGEVTIEVGEKESLTVTTDDNIMPYVHTEVKNNTLILTASLMCSIRHPPAGQQSQLYNISSNFSPNLREIKPSL